MNKNSILLLTISTVGLMLIAVFSLMSINRIEILLVALLSAIVFGSISPLVAARRLYFLAVEASHIALSAATFSIVLANTTPINHEVFWAIALGLLAIYVMGFAIHKGMSPDIVTSIATAASISGSVIAIHLILTRYRISYSLWSLLLGDPLLISRIDLYILTILSIATLAISIAIYKVVIYVGVDRDGALLTFKNANVYDFLFFTALGISSIALLRIVGYIIEHILILLPALVSMNLVEGSKKIMLISIYVSIASTLLGFIFSLKTNIAPAGAVGVIALLMYIFSLVTNRLRRYG